MNQAYRLLAAVIFYILIVPAGRCAENTGPAPRENSELIAAITSAYDSIQNLMFSFIQETGDNNTTVRGTLFFKRPNKFKSEIIVSDGNSRALLRNVSVFDGTFLWQEQTAPVIASPPRVIKSKIDENSREGEALLEQVDVRRQFSALLRGYEIMSTQNELFEQRPVNVLKFRIRPEERNTIVHRMKMSGGFNAEKIPEEKIFYWDAAAGFCVKLETLNQKHAALTTITCRDIKINGGIDGAVFSYDPPEGAAVMDMTDRLGREIRRQEYDGEENEKAGSLSPGFVLTDLFGKPFDSAQTRGKIVIIGFWPAQSPAGSAAVLFLDKIYQDNSGENDIAVLTITRGKEPALEYVDRNGCVVPVLLDDNGRVAEQFGVVSVPRIFVIDQQGVIYAVYIGDHADIRDTLAKDIKTLREKAEKSIGKK